MPETNETHVITDLPNKKSKLNNPFVKKATDPEVSAEETATKRNFSTAKKAGAALLVTGAAVALASKLANRRAKTEESTEASSDTPTDN